MNRPATSESVIAYGWLTDVGCVRTENQDYCGKFPAESWDLESGPGQLVIIADGMGGLYDGARASSHAVKRLGALLFDGSDTISPDDLRAAFHTVNKEIFELGAEAARGIRMGTTCTALLLRNGSAIVAHAGDSRLYRINAKGIVQLTNDHSNVAEMMRRGILTGEEAASHPERSKLYNALGPSKEMQIDIIDNIALTTDERFVLCTDGLHGKVSSQEIMEATLNNPPDEACRKLTVLAKERGGEDNITVQIVHMQRPARFMERVFKRSSR